jgi:hypothetical protein
MLHRPARAVLKPPPPGCPMSRSVVWACLLLAGCLEFDKPGGPPAEPAEVCDKMEECGYRYEQVDECEDQLLEDGEGGAVCADRRS